MPQSRRKDGRYNNGSEMCSYYVYDEESECYVCDMDLDEDDLVKFLQGTNDRCAYFSMNDEYAVVRKQM